MIISRETHFCASEFEKKVLKRSPDASNETGIDIICQTRIKEEDRTCNTDCDVIKKESRGKEEKNKEANNDTWGRRRRGMLGHCHRASTVQTRWS